MWQEDFSFSTLDVVTEASFELSVLGEDTGNISTFEVGDIDVISTFEEFTDEIVIPERVLGLIFSVAGSLKSH